MRFDSFSAAARQRLAYERATWRSREDALSLTVNGFCKEVLKQQPMEFAIEAQKLFAFSLDGSVGLYGTIGLGYSQAFKSSIHFRSDTKKRALC